MEQPRKSKYSDIITRLDDDSNLIEAEKLIAKSKLDREQKDKKNRILEIQLDMMQKTLLLT